MSPDTVEEIMTCICYLRASAYRLGKAGLSGAELDYRYTELKSQERQIKEILEKEV